MNNKSRNSKIAAELTKTENPELKFCRKKSAYFTAPWLRKARMEVDLSEDPEFNEYGSDTIQLLFQANTGFPMKPVHTAISGGERSRVMLAVKKIMAENSELPTLILDEIDTGVSGRVAEEIGKLMHEMGQDMQLIVITHLAQVAAKGDYNYKVMKSEVGGKRSRLLFL